MPPGERKVGDAGLGGDAGAGEHHGMARGVQHFAQADRRPGWFAHGLAACCAARISRIRALVPLMSGKRSPCVTRASATFSASCMPIARFGGCFDVGGRHHQHAVLVGEHHVARRHRHAAAGDRHAELAADEARLAGDRRQAARPDRHAVGAQFLDVGGDAVDDDAEAAGLARREGHAAAAAGVARVAGAVDHQDVAGAELAQRVMHDGGVVAVETDGDRGAGDAPVGQQGADAGVHEADLAEVADRCGFGLQQQRQALGAICGGGSLMTNMRGPPGWFRREANATALGVPIALDLRAVHDPSRVGIERIAPVHGAAIVPQHQVADPPGVVPARSSSRVA
jgi:hypothetical protein